MDRLFRESGLMRGKWDEVHYADGRTHGEVTIERALQVTDERYDSSTDGGSRDESDVSKAANSVATRESVESVGDAESEGDQDRSRAHLFQRNRLLRQRVQEQAARIEALESALERGSKEEPAGSELEEDTNTSSDATEVAGHGSIRGRLWTWLRKGAFDE